jgi:iron complex outermembrane receptor protein
MAKVTQWRAALLASSILTAGLIAALPASAQTAPPSSEEAMSVDEVIVTARRRNERLQDVPIAVTAVSGVTLARENIVDTVDLIRKSPSLTMSPGLGSSRATPNFAIRGQSQQEQTPLVDGSVAVYTGDIVAARAQGLNQTLMDIGSVEVLKGPQGTLFGRNSTGGAILIKPNKPTRDFEGYIQGGLGEFNQRSLEGMVNLPMGDKAQLRVAANMQQRDGYIIDTITNKDINYVDTWAFRASLALQPTDRIDSLTVFNAFNEDDGGQGAFIYNVNPSGSFNSAPARAARNYPTLQSLLAAQQARDPYHTASGTPMHTKVETWDVANTSSFRLTDSISVKNIIGWRSVKLDAYEDTDGLPIPLLEIERRFDDDQFSEEFQILGDTGNLNWIVGAYYFNETFSDSGASITGAVDPGDIQPSSVYDYPSWSNTFSTGENTSYAVFAQGTYKLDALLKGLSVTAGVRQNWDERKATIRNQTNTACRFTVDNDDNPATPEVNPGLANCALPLSQDFSEPTYTISAEYKLDPDTLFYIAHRHGYRTGGFAARAATEAGLRRYFTPEIVDDIEFGAKRDWRWNGMFLRTNLALYKSKYKDIQRQLTDPNTIPVTTVAVNAASAEVSGAEFEFLFRPNSIIELSGFYSYTDAAFEKYITPAGQDRSNDPFARAPDNLFSATLRVNLPTPDSFGQVSGGITYYYHGDYWINDDTNPAPYRETTHFPSYELINVDAQWTNILGSRADLSLFVTNVTDEVILTPQLAIITSLGFDARSVQPPRMFGARLKYRFGG